MRGEGLGAQVVTSLEITRDGPNHGQIRFQSRTCDLHLALDRVQYLEIMEIDDRLHASAALPMCSWVCRNSIALQTSQHAEAATHIWDEDLTRRFNSSSRKLQY